MKLFNLHRGDRFKLAGDDNSPIFKLDHIDGMYSVCYVVDGHNNSKKIIHVSAFTAVIEIRTDVISD